MDGCVRTLEVLYPNNSAGRMAGPVYGLAREDDAEHTHTRPM